MLRFSLGGWIGSRVWRLELPDRRASGRPKRGYMDEVKEDTMVVGEKRMEALRNGKTPNHAVLYFRAPVETYNSLNSRIILCELSLG